MAQLLKHYWVDRDNPSVYATTAAHYAQPRFGTIAPQIEGLDIQVRLVDENGINYCLSQCPDDTVVPDVDGVSVVTQAEWDAEIAAFDARQTVARRTVQRKYRDAVLKDTDWIVVKAKETGTNLSADFKSWRTELRDLPSVGITTDALPAAPAGVVVTEGLTDGYAGELRGTYLVNDPLPALPEPELPS